MMFFLTAVVLSLATATNIRFGLTGQKTSGKYFPPHKQNVIYTYKYSQDMIPLTAKSTGPVSHIYRTLYAIVFCSCEPL